MKLLRLLLVPFAVLVVALIRMLRLPVRFGPIMSGRLGHLAGNMECYLCEKDAGLSPGFDVFYHQGTPWSAQLDKMLRRVVRIDPTPFTRICAIVNELFTGWERHRVDTANVDRDIHNLFEKYPPHLAFTPEEIRVARWLLMQAIGIPYDAKWVYLVARDEAKHPHLPYHSYRNTDIDTYEQAAIALAERGYYVVRVGSQVAKPFKAQHPRIIDFASRLPYDDFLAVYLGAYCEFCLSSGTGPDAIPVIFRRPVCYVNYVPLEYLQTYHRGSLAIWKHHMKDGKRMTPAEIYASGAGHFMTAQEYADAGITLVDNTPEEIADVALEMAYQIEGKTGCSPQCEADHIPGYETLHIEYNQSHFWNAFPRSVSTYNGAKMHGKINMRIGREFLRGYD